MNIKKKGIEGRWKRATGRCTLLNMSSCYCSTDSSMTKIYFMVQVNLIFIAPAYSKVRYRGSTFCPFVHPSLRPSTIYVKVLTL